MKKTELDEENWDSITLRVWEARSADF